MRFLRIIQHTLLLTTMLLAPIAMQPVAAQDQAATPDATLDQIDTFNLGVASYFDQPLDEVLEVSDRVPADEVPVVFFLANRGDVSSDQVLDMRAAGSSWMDISDRLGVEPKDYHVKVKDKVKKSDLASDAAWRDFADTPRRDWHTLRLDDGDIVDQVNLRFLSDTYVVDKRDVITWRDRGRDYAGIARDSDPRHDWRVGHGPDGWIIRDYRRGHGPDSWVDDGRPQRPHDWRHGHRPRPDRGSDRRGHGDQHRGDRSGDRPPLSS